ncbi:MAG: methionyl-tRNA formyltransferase [Atribacterota bacterium]|nr:methionyl-tRNA formyltransferase [Atribacterota bacterium]MDY0135282.1 methionyl-tRNA formyltransferase [Atribacterota bacterium]HOA99181.1 methionyl-tRNA formyltransferase [Candidatus Atribacteria bacterium]HPZ40070.1 methionyl-tRNA formyltransferase [Candidatus Atribacteria bacterium]
MKIVFMGTSSFAVLVLEELLKKEENNILGVVTKVDRPAGRGRKLRPSPVKKKAEEEGLTIWQPERVNAPEFLDILRCVSPEVIIVAAYGQILRRDLLSIPPRGAINVHASLLPSFRGPDPIRSALLQGEKETGVTIMLMDEGVDTGPILAQKKVEIEREDNYQSLTEKLGKEGGKLLVETLPRWARGEIAPRPQEGEVSYAPILKKEKARINWEDSAVNIVNQVRAFSPYPGAYTYFQDRRIKILKANSKEGVSAPPGTVVEINPQGFVVAAGEGGVLVEEVQPESRQVMTSREFCCGYHLREGEQLL